MSRLMLGLVSVMMLSGPSLADEPKSETQLGKDIRIPTNIGFATNVSPDGRAATLIFENAYVASEPVTQGAQEVYNQSQAQSKVLTVNIPYSTDQRSVKMSLDIRGYASADAASAVRLIACAGDATQVIDLTSEDGKEVKLKGKAKATLAKKQALEESGDFQDRVEFTVRAHAAKPTCQITIVLLAEHDTDKANDGGAVVMVDSLDLQINPSDKAAYKR